MTRDKRGTENRGGIANMMRELFYKEHSIGIVGECTSVYPECGDCRHTTLRVGDLISFYKYGKIHTKVVAKSSSYGIFGFGGHTLDFDKVTRIMSYEDLTEDIFQKTQEPDSREGRERYTIRDMKEKEMTIEQVQEELGYPIKIIGSEPSEDK